MLRLGADSKVKRVSGSTGLPSRQLMLGHVRWDSSPTAGRGRLVTLARRLNRRTRHRAVRAEHAAIALLRAQPCAATRAHIEKLAGICRHGFRSCRCAVWAGDDGFENHDASLKAGTQYRRPGGVSEHRRFQAVDSEIAANRQGEEVNHLVGMRPEEMGSENPAVVLHTRYEQLVRG